MMTSYEAFEDLMAKDEGVSRFDLTLSDTFKEEMHIVWQAACEWQKHKDAEIMLWVASTTKAPDAYFVFADAIRDQPI